MIKIGIIGTGSIAEWHTKEFQKNPKAAEDLLAVGISPRDDSLDVIEHAAWTATARTVLNLRETVGRY